jgi:hypothetical protein
MMKLRVSAYEPFKYEGIDQDEGDGSSDISNGIANDK